MREGDYAYVSKTSKDGESSMFRGVEVMIFLKKKKKQPQNTCAKAKLPH